MGKKKKQQRAPVPQQEPGSGFGGLGAALAAQGLAAKPSSGEGAAVAVATPPKAAASKAPAAKPAGLLSGKAVVRQERKGRGGKTVTVVDGVALHRVDDLDALAKTMRKALGTGARVEGNGIVVQGDQRKKAAAWLEKQGATVVIGN